MGFLKVSMSANTVSSRNTSSRERESLQVAVDGEEFLKLRGRTRIPLEYNNNNNNNSNLIIYGATSINLIGRIVKERVVAYFEYFLYIYLLY